MTKQNPQPIREISFNFNQFKFTNIDLKEGEKNLFDNHQGLLELLGRIYPNQNADTTIEVQPERALAEAIDECRKNSAIANDYFSISNEQLLFDAEKAEKDINEILKNGFPNDKDAVLENLLKTKKNIEENVFEPSHPYAADLVKFRVASMYYNQLQALKELKKAKEAKEKSDEKLKAIEAAQHVKPAPVFDAKKYFAALQAGKNPDHLFRPMSRIEEAWIRQENIILKNNLEKAKTAFNDASNHLPTNKEALKPSELKHSTLDNTAALKDGFTGLVKDLLGFSNATHSAAWDKAGRLTEKSVKRFNDLIGSSVAQLDADLATLDASTPEGRARIAAIKKRQEELQKFLSNDTNAKELNDFLKKDGDAILKAEQDSVLTPRQQALLAIKVFCLVSPLLGIPPIGLILDIFEPFFNQLQDLPTFLSNFLSTDGPFGALATITDGMELDLLAHMMFSWVPPGAEGIVNPFTAVVQGITQNPFTEGAFTMVQGVFGGQLGGPALALLLEARYPQVDAVINRVQGVKLTAAQEQLEKDLKAFGTKIGKAIDLDSQNGRKAAEQIGKDFVEVKTLAEFLQQAYTDQDKQKSCEMLINTLFGDKDPNKDRAKAVIEALQGVGKLDLETALYNAKQSKGAEFEKLLTFFQSDQEDERGKVFDFDEKIKEQNEVVSNFEKDHQNKLLTKSPEGTKPIIFSSLKFGDTINVGDVLEIDTTQGKRYCQYTAKDAADDKASPSQSILGKLQAINKSRTELVGISFLQKKAFDGALEKTKEVQTEKPKTPSPDPKPTSASLAASQKVTKGVMAH